MFSEDSLGWVCINGLFVQGFIEDKDKDKEKEKTKDKKIKKTRFSLPFFVFIDNSLH